MAPPSLLRSAAGLTLLLAQRVAGAPRWSEVAANGSWPDPRFSHSAVVTDDCRMLIFGGNTLDAVNHLYALDFARAEWTKLKPQGDAPAKRYGHSAVALSGGRMLVFGGYNGSFFGDVHLFDPGSCDGDVCTGPSWQQLDCGGDAPCPRDGHAALLLPDNRTMLVVGGFDGERCFNDVHALDTESLTWRQLDAGGEDAPMPAPRYMHAAQLCADGFYLFGGYVDGQTPPFENDLWRFELDTDEAEGEGEGEGEGGAAVTGGTWVRLNASGTPPGGSFGHAAATDAEGRVFVFGGFGGAFSNALHIFTPDGGEGAGAGESTGAGAGARSSSAGGGGTWRKAKLAGELPSPRHKHSMVLSPRGRLVVFGGNDFSITRGLYELDAALAAAPPQPAGLLEQYGYAALGMKLLSLLLLVAGRMLDSTPLLRVAMLLALAAEYPRVTQFVQTLRESRLDHADAPLHLRGGAVARLASRAGGSPLPLTGGREAGGARGSLLRLRGLRPTKAVRH